MGRLLIAVASLVAQILGSRFQLLSGMWDLPQPGTDTVSLALAGEFFTAEPLGKPPFRVDLYKL